MRKIREVLSRSNSQLEEEATQSLEELRALADADMAAEAETQLGEILPEAVPEAPGSSGQEAHVIEDDSQPLSPAAAPEQDSVLTLLEIVRKKMFLVRFISYVLFAVASSD